MFLKVDTFFSWVIPFVPEGTLSKGLGGWVHLLHTIPHCQLCEAVLENETLLCWNSVKYFRSSGQKAVSCCRGALKALTHLECRVPLCSWGWGSFSVTWRFFHSKFLHAFKWTLFKLQFYIHVWLRIPTVEIVIMKWNNRDLWKWNSHRCCAVWAVAAQLLFCGSVFVKNFPSKAKSFHFYQFALSWYR